MQDEAPFRVADIPLPPKGMVIEPAESDEEWHKNMRDALLRWHPDKWSKLEALLVETEREQLKRVLQAMFVAVGRAKERGWGYVRFQAPRAWRANQA